MPKLVINFTLYDDNNKIIETAIREADASTDVDTLFPAAATTPEEDKKHLHYVFNNIVEITCSHLEMSVDEMALEFKPTVW